MKTSKDQNLRAEKSVQVKETQETRPKNPVANVPSGHQSDSVSKTPVFRDFRKKKNNDLI